MGSDPSLALPKLGREPSRRQRPLRLLPKLGREPSRRQRPLRLLPKLGREPSCRHRRQRLLPRFGGGREGVDVPIETYLTKQQSKVS